MNDKKENELKQLEQINNIIKNEDKTAKNLIEQINMLLNILSDNNLEYLFAFKMKDDDFLYLDNLEIDSCNCLSYTLVDFFISKINSVDCSCESCKIHITRLHKFVLSMGMHNKDNSDVSMLKDLISKVDKN